MQEMTACDKACRQRKGRGLSIYAEVYLDKAVHAAGDEVLPIWRKSGDLWVYLPSKLDGPVQLHAIISRSEWVHGCRNIGRRCVFEHPQTTECHLMHPDGDTARLVQISSLVN